MATLTEIVIKTKLQKAKVGSAPYVEIGDIELQTKKIIEKVKPSVAGAVIAPVNSILISKVRPSRGAVTLLTESKVVSNGFAVLCPQKDKCLSKYLFYNLAWNDDFFSYLASKSTGATYPTVKEADILEYGIKDLPGIKEQVAIVALLEEAEELKQKRAEAEQKMTTVIPALFNKMFGDPVQNTNKYPLIKLGSIASIGYGRPDKIDRSITSDKGVLLIRIGNVRLNGTLNLEDKVYTPKTVGYENELLKKGDLLFNWRNGSAEHVGKTAIIEEDIECINASFLLRIIPNQKKVDSYWLWQYLNLLRAYGFFVSRSRIQINSKINAGELKEFNVPLPSIKLQTEFAKKVIEIGAFKHLQSKSNVSINSLFSALLSRAFSTH